MYKKLLTLFVSLLLASSTLFATPSLLKTRRDTPLNSAAVARLVAKQKNKSSIRSFAASYRPVLLERFLKYVSYDRQSSETEPITAAEIETAHKLYN